MINDQAPAMRRKAEREAKTDYQIEYGFTLIAGVMLGMLIFMMADAI